VSSDIAFWKAAAGEPEEIYDGLADGITDGLEAHPDMAAFRGELLSRWPALADVLEPNETDPAATSN
jgi:hypothetical protein